MRYLLAVAWMFIGALALTIVADAAQITNPTSHLVIARPLTAGAVVYGQSTFALGRDLTLSVPVGSDLDKALQAKVGNTVTITVR